MTVRVFNEQLPVVGRYVRDALTDLGEHEPTKDARFAGVFRLDGNTLVIERLEYQETDAEPVDVDVFTITRPVADRIEVGEHHFGKEHDGVRYCTDRGCNAALRKSDVPASFRQPDDRPGVLPSVQRR